MLRFREIEIRNFAVFEHVVVRPSVASQRPLTVIRAENGSGKTTFLRALLWAMYGEKGLPGKASVYSVHPAWWRLDDEGVETEVSLEFETDGSSRFDPAPGQRVDTYRLTRRVRTVRQEVEGAEGFRRLEERVVLMVKPAGGVWERSSFGPVAVAEQLLPFELRDFFVMDADKAADYVGGTENRMLDPKEVEKLTTDAVRGLLGISVFRKASERLTQIASQFGRSAARAAGSEKIEKLQADQDRCEERRDSLRERIEQNGEKLRSLQADLANCRELLNTELMHAGAYDDLVERKRLAERQKARATTRRSEELTRLSRGIEGEELLAPLGAPALRKVVGGLKPHYDAGDIPQRHLAFVRSLLAEGACVCGEDLAGDGDRRRRVLEQLARAEAREPEASFLGDLYEAADGLLAAAEASDWRGQRRVSARNLATAEQEITNADQELREVNARIGAIDREKIRSLRNEEAAFESQIRQVERETGRDQQEEAEALKEVESAKKKLRAAMRTVPAGKENLRAQAAAELGALVLSTAYENVQTQQVEELSIRMHGLFRRMAANIPGDDLSLREDARESVGMIAQVGIRPVEGRTDLFEIFALNHQGRVMPATEINGASRRVLAVSFILALCAESKTHAPLVADSLLNTMSGAVRRSTLETVVANSEQPILLLTGSDLEAESEVETVRRRAGRVYTLTGQWQASGSGQEGDVVRRTASREHVALLCGCGPREYCAVCERVGQAGLPGWSQRPTHMGRG